LHLVVELFWRFAMSDCKWMFGDVAKGAWGFNELAHLNPFRWSGRTKVEKAINELEESIQVDKCRPILVKVPAGVATRHRRFENIEEATAYLKRSSCWQPREIKESRRGPVMLDAADVAVARTHQQVAAKDETVTKAQDAFEETKTQQKSATEKLAAAAPVEAEVQVKPVSATHALSVAHFNPEAAKKIAAHALKEVASEEEMVTRAQDSLEEAKVDQQTVTTNLAAAGTDAAKVNVTLVSATHVS